VTSARSASSRDPACEATPPPMSRHHDRGTPRCTLSPAKCLPSRVILSSRHVQDPFAGKALLYIQAACRPPRSHRLLQTRFSGAGPAGCSSAGLSRVGRPAGNAVTRMPIRTARSHWREGRTRWHQQLVPTP
jgi:hypothetical protein